MDNWYFVLASSFWRVSFKSGRYLEVADNLRVKGVMVGKRRYIVCFIPQEAIKDAADREAIVKSLQDKLSNGSRQLLGNAGYSKFLKPEKDALSLDSQKIEDDALYDGKYVLRTNTKLSSSEVAIQYKHLLLVEPFFRAAKSMLNSRPIFHQGDEAIKRHIFCSFLVLLLRHELETRLKKQGNKFEWADIRRDLESLAEVQVREGEEWYRLRISLMGVTGKVLRVLRAELDWTQEDLAIKLGISRQAVIAIEKEKYHPSLPLAFKISRLFQKRAEDIFRYEDKGDTT